VQSWRLGGRKAKIGTERRESDRVGGRHHRHRGRGPPSVVLPLCLSTLPPTSGSPERAFSLEKRHTRKSRCACRPAFKSRRCRSLVFVQVQRPCNKAWRVDPSLSATCRAVEQPITPSGSLGRHHHRCGEGLSRKPSRRVNACMAM